VFYIIIIGVFGVFFCFRPIMKLAVRKEAMSMGWYMERMIGVMVEAICMLWTSRERRSNNDDFHAQMTVHINRAEEFS
jgi:hypothetical protein